MGEGLKPMPEDLGNEEVTEEQFVAEQQDEKSGEKKDGDLLRNLEEMQRHQQSGTWQTREQDH